MKNAMRHFTLSDWYALAGAERFPDGSEPLIAEYKDLVVVVDSNGIHAWVHDHECEGLYYSGLCKRHCICIADDILAAVEGMTNEQIVEYLKHPEI